MKYLFILNDPAYGTERTWNGLRLATNILKKDASAELTVFLMGDGVGAAKAGQQTPNGYYNLENMLIALMANRGKILLCGTCMDARGLKQEELLAGASRSNLDALTDLTIAADKVLVF